MLSPQEARENRLRRRLIMRRRRLQHLSVRFGDNSSESLHTDQLHRNWFGLGVNGMQRGSNISRFENVSRSINIPVSEISRQNRLRRRLLLRKKRMRLVNIFCRESSIANSDTKCDERSLPSSIHTLGPFGFVCSYCCAIFWEGERIKRGSKRRNPIFSMCCQCGKVNVPLLLETPIPLKLLIDYQGGNESRKFWDNIRAYNSMFSFTSLGANIDHDINKKPGPYVFHINGQTHHLIGSLLPVDGERPKFAQLYVYDTENEVDNRLCAFNKGDNVVGIERRVVQSLLTMFDDKNQIVKAFRMVRERYKEGNQSVFKLKILGKRTSDSMQYGTPVFPEIAGLIVGDFQLADAQRDIIVEHKTEGLKRISDLHPSFMSMQYPILFPYGEDGYSLDIPYELGDNDHATKRRKVTKREYYAFRIQQRSNEGKTLLMGGRLFQQFLVDAFCCVEQSRLQYIRFNQSKLRSEIYTGVQDAIFRGDTDGSAIGKRIILPSTFTGGPRYMVQNYQDAMAICRCFGQPDLFITFTCNAQWPEIYDALQMIPGQKPEDRPDLISQVFKLKVDALINDIAKGIFFTKSKAVVYTIEFQKRGLPHVHILVWLQRDPGEATVGYINSIISAELPDAVKDPTGHEAVSKFMIHGPYGVANPKCPCMVNGKCSKYFPKRFHAQTSIDDHGSVQYMRRDNKSSTIKNNVMMDNRFVVPHNLFLVVKYQAHINVEWCNKIMLIKYLFKYINKGPDRARVMISQTSNSEDASVHEVDGITGSGRSIDSDDEIKTYLDCRYLSPPEAVWRLLQYPIHFRNPSVERLSIHLPMMNPVYFHDDEELVSVVECPGSSKTMFTEWMYANATFEDARQLTYSEFPTKWVWRKKKKEWARRRRGGRIGQIVYVHPSSGELYFLRMLLNIVKGPCSYEEIRTIDGVIYDSYRSACHVLGLLGDDKEWNEAIIETSNWAMPSQLRELFVTMLLHCEVGDPIALFDSHWHKFTDDIQYHIRNVMGISQAT